MSFDLFPDAPVLWYNIFCFTGATGMISIGILTISDKGARGEREDRSGPVIRDIMVNAGAEVAAMAIVPDERELIAGKLAEWADGGRMDIILTTGGTGLAKRDVTPEATLQVIDPAERRSPCKGCR